MQSISMTNILHECIKTICVNNYFTLSKLFILILSEIFPGII